MGAPRAAGGEPGGRSPCFFQRSPHRTGPAVLPVAGGQAAAGVNVWGLWGGGCEWGIKGLIPPVALSVGKGGGSSAGVGGCSMEELGAGPYVLGGGAVPGGVPVWCVGAPVWWGVSRLAGGGV